MGLGFILGAVLVAVGLGGTGPNHWKAALGAASSGFFGVVFLLIMVVELRELRSRKHIALALRADSIRLSAEDDPPDSTSVTPGTP